MLIVFIFYFFRLLCTRGIFGVGCLSRRRLTLTSLRSCRIPPGVPYFLSFFRVIERKTQLPLFFYHCFRFYQNPAFPDRQCHISATQIHSVCHIKKIEKFLIARSYSYGRKNLNIPILSYCNRFIPSTLMAFCTGWRTLYL